MVTDLHFHLQYIQWFLQYVNKEDRFALKFMDKMGFLCVMETNYMVILQRGIRVSLLLMRKFILLSASKLAYQV